MATPMNAYRALAFRWGVDPKDEEAVERFFSETVVSWTVEEQAGVMEYLLHCDGVDSHLTPTSTYFDQLIAEAGAPLPPGETPYG